MWNFLWLAAAWTGFACWLAWFCGIVLGIVYRKTIANLWRLMRTLVHPPVKRRRGQPQPTAYQQRLMDSMRSRGNR